MNSNLDEILEVSDNDQNNTRKTLSSYKNKYADALGTFAIIELISSIIAAIYIWINYGTIEVLSGTYYTFTETSANPLGMGLGLGVLIQGIVVYVILSALKVMAEDIADIKSLSLKED